jgi:hypothetical protein
MSVDYLRIVCGSVGCCDEFHSRWSTSQWWTAIIKIPSVKAIRLFVSRKIYRLKLQTDKFLNSWVMKRLILSEAAFRSDEAINFHVLVHDHVHVHVPVHVPGRVHVQFTFVFVSMFMTMFMTMSM